MVNWLLQVHLAPLPKDNHLQQSLQFLPLPEQSTCSVVSQVSAEKAKKDNWRESLGQVFTMGKCEGAIRINSLPTINHSKRSLYGGVSHGWAGAPSERLTESPHGSLWNSVQVVAHYLSLLPVNCASALLPIILTALDSKKCIGPLSLTQTPSLRNLD